MKGLTLTNISKKYRNKTILEGIDFKFQPNKIYGLLGRNGVGKSTLLNIITDRIFADSGEVKLDGKEVHNNAVALHQIYLINDDEMYPRWIKVKDMYKMADIAYGDFDYENAHRLAKRFGVDENLQLKKLSTGLRVSAKLINAFCVNADFIFLDEPTQGLDATLRQIFYEELMSTYAQRPRTFVLSTHLIDEVQNLLEDILIIGNKQLIYSGSVDDLLNKIVSISGPSEQVSQIIKDAKIYSTHTIAGNQTAYIDDTQLDLQDVTGIQVEKVDLQTAFIELTQGKGDE